MGKELKEIENINHSPFPRSLKNRQEWGHNSFYDPRPTNLPKPQYEFHLDYDFEKYRVHSLSDVFGKTAWEVKDSIRTFVRGLDPNVTGMHDRGGRERHPDRFGRMTLEYHFYGEQLGWNGLHFAAGQFLRQYPVTNRSYDDDPWPNWLSRELLTRIDGLWLADGIDATPLDTQINLLEEGETGLVITGNRRKLLSQVGIDSQVPKDLVVDGSWGQRTTSRSMSRRRSRAQSTRGCWRPNLPAKNRSGSGCLRDGKMTTSMNRVRSRIANRGSYHHHWKPDSTVTIPWAPVAQ